MKRFPVNMITCIKGLVAHQIITASAISVVVLMYAIGISMMMAKGGDVTSLLLYVNPVVLLAAMVLMGQYLYAYDNHVVNGRERVEWPQWKMWSFVAGLFFMVVLWSSPMNFLIHRSMTLYTIKLMGEFELAAPLLVFGMPSNIFTINHNTRYLYGLLKFAHRPAVTSIILLFLLVFWSMSNQMYLGLKYGVLFTLLPGAYLAVGILVWMQSLKVFPSLPNLRNHLQKAVYVWATELAMMGMGGIWFWSATSMNPMQSSHMLWGLTRLSDQHLAGLFMTALSLPTMCLVTWHFWQWMEEILHDPETRLYSVIDNENAASSNHQ